MRLMFRWSRSDSHPTYLPILFPMGKRMRREGVGKLEHTNRLSLPSPSWAHAP